MAKWWVSEVVRSGALAEVDGSAVAVWLVLLDHVWRSASKGRRELRAAFRGGELAALVKRAKIAELTGLSVRQVSRRIAELERVGWVETKRTNGQMTVYVVGRIESGGEVLLARPGTSTSPPVNPGPGTSTSRVTKGDPGHLRPGGGDIYVPGPGTSTSRGTRTPKENSKEEPEPRVGSLEGEKKIRRVRSARPRTRREEKKKKTRRGWSDLEFETPPPSSPVADPKHPVRTLHPEEARHLQSARAKAERGEFDSYTGLEAIATWRVRYWLAFGFEDPDLSTMTAQKKLGRSFVARARQWEDGSRERMLDYLRSTIRWWKGRKESGALGTVPSLSRCLESKKGGEVPWTYKRWKAGGMRVE